MPKTRLEIITAERVVLNDEADIVIAPGSLGELGILPRHAPLLTGLVPGELRYRKDGAEFSLAVTGGFMEVQPQRVTVLADAAERAEEIDLARAEAARQRAIARMADRSGMIDLERAKAALLRASVRIKVAQKRRPKQP